MALQHGETPQQHLHRTFRGPKALCTCGHLGDGSDSDHKDTFTPGHGGCRECACPQFTWTGWAPVYQAAIDQVMGKKKR